MLIDSVHGLFYIDYTCAGGAPFWNRNTVAQSLIFIWTKFHFSLQCDTVISLFSDRSMNTQYAGMAPSLDDYNKF